MYRQVSPLEQNHVTTPITRASDSNDSNSSGRSDNTNTDDNNESHERMGLNFW